MATFLQILTVVMNDIVVDKESFDKYVSWMSYIEPFRSELSSQLMLLIMKIPSSCLPLS